jgi:hypothetical protein
LKFGAILPWSHPPTPPFLTTALISDSSNRHESSVVRNVTAHNVGDTKGSNNI